MNTPNIFFPYLKVWSLFHQPQKCESLQPTVSNFSLQISIQTFTSPTQQWFIFKKDSNLAEISRHQRFSSSKYLKLQKYNIFLQFLSHVAQKKEKKKNQLLGQKLSWVAVFKTFHCRPLGPASLSCYIEALLDRFCFSPPIDNWQCQSVKCQTLWRRMGVQSDATTTWLTQFSLLSFPSMISHFKHCQRHNGPRV